MPPAIQSELARDQFVQALTLNKIRLHVQFGHPASPGKALDCVIEWETAVCATRLSLSITVTAGPRLQTRDQCGWTSLFKQRKSRQLSRQGMKVKRHPPVCWGCGQRGHLLRQCRVVGGQQGNRAGSV